jgi:excisionase family DNA binding protein
MPDLNGFVTTQEAAEQLGRFNVDHVRRMLREGDLEGRKVGYMWFVSVDSIQRYLKETAGMNKFDPRRGN